MTLKVETRKDGCYIVEGMFEGETINYVVCQWEQKDFGKPTIENAKRFLKKYPEKR